MKKDKTFIIKIESDVYNNYKIICQKNGYNMSQRLRNFINEDIKKHNKK